MNETLSGFLRGKRIPVLPRVVALCVTAVLCAGCAGGSTKPPVPVPTGQPSSGCETDESGGPVGLVLGFRANSPKPVFPGDFDSHVSALLSAAAKADPPSTVVVTDLDGSPQPSYIGSFKPQSVNSIARKAERDQYVADLGTTMGSLKPSAPQADDLAAIRKTAEQMKGRGTLIVADSGLQTTAPLDFRTPGLLEATPADIADSLSSSGDLPDLHGISVVFVGLGQVVDPQPQLGQPLVTNLTNIWHAVLMEAGACDVSDQPDASSEKIDKLPGDYPPVGLVPLPVQPPMPPVCGTTVLADSGTVGFEPNSTVFRDPTAAHATLAAYAARIKPYLPGVTVEVVGTTATWGDEAGRLKLSAERAQVVVDELVKLGVPRADLEPRGVGTHWPTHVNDVTKNGLDPVLAEQNRSVVLVGHCSGSPAS